MTTSKTPTPNRIKEALSRIYEGKTPYFKEYLRRYKEDPKSRVFAPLAEAYRKSGKIEEAIKVCLEGLKHHAQFAGGRVALAKCYVEKKEYPKAKEQLELVVDQAPENLLAQRLLGDCYLAMGDRRSALDTYKIAAMLAPNDVKLAQHIRSLEKEEDPSPEFVAPVEEEDAKSEPEAMAAAEPVSETFEEAPKSDPLPEPEEKYREMVPMVSKEGRVELVELGGHEVSNMDELLGITDTEEDAFQVDSVSVLVEEDTSEAEINTETLGDLYFSQGQYDRSLRIFRKIQKVANTPELEKKIEASLEKLGVGDGSEEAKQKKIEMLQGILGKLHEGKTDAQL